MEIMEERQVEQIKDLKNTEDNCEKRRKIWKKLKMNSEKI